MFKPIFKPSPLFSVLIFLALLPVARAEVKLAALFSDHMVLQRGVAVPIWGWASPGEVITVTLGQWTKTATTAANGRWEVRLDPMDAGGPYDMAITSTNYALVKDIYIGEVWLGSGQSNMDFRVAAGDRYWCGAMNEQAEVASANYPLIRMFKVNLKMSDTPEKEVEGQWEVTTPETVKEYSAAGYFFSRELYNDMHVPIGFIDSSYGASTAQAWISPEAIQQKADLKYLVDAYTQAKAAWEPVKVQKTADYSAAMVKWAQQSAKVASGGHFLPKEPGLGDPHHNQHNPSVLFNGMIAPLLPYAIRGAVWYQGESNEGGKNEQIYRGMMETLVADWRAHWGGGDFPFFYVQLAALGQPALTPPDRAQIAMTREEQRLNLSIPNSGMVVTIDIGDPANVHPKNKQEMSRRLALLARHRVYKEDVIDSGPMYDGFKIEGSAIRVHFITPDGLASHGGTPIGFAIAGADKKWTWAQAKIDGDSVVLTNAAVPSPVAVRYAFADYPPANLYGKGTDGLPASPFKADDW